VSKKEKFAVAGKIFFRHLLIILLFLCLDSSVEGAVDTLFSNTGINPIKDNKRAPNFCLEDLKGKKVELKHFKGKVVFLNFWATWCGPCKEEMPSMEALYNHFREKDFIFLAVSVDYEGIKPVKEFIEKQRYTFPVLLDPKCETLDLFEVKAIPTTLLIDKKGLIIGKTIGPIDWKRGEVMSILNFLLAK
jgi:peroxiredoxin